MLLARQAVHIVEMNEAYILDVETECTHTKRDRHALVVLMDQASVYYLPRQSNHTVYMKCVQQSNSSDLVDPDAAIAASRALQSIRVVRKLVETIVDRRCNVTLLARH
jgi:hypothetical protein